MKKLIISFGKGLFISLIALCITSELLGILYTSNNLQEIIAEELFKE